MPSDGIFGPMSATPAMAAAVSSEAWLRAMLDVEAALAWAEAEAGVIPREAAEMIAATCAAAGLDADALGRAAVDSATVVVPFVAALRALVPEDAAGWVHFGATSQDILDTAMMLVARQALDLVIASLGVVGDECARLAAEHRNTVMPGRTLLQQAVPITFGLKAAGWLSAVADAQTQLLAFRRERLALQFGGAAGTLASLGDRGLAVSRHLAERLGLSETAVPWHTARGRVAELSSALGVAAGAMGKIALDVALLCQTEVGEVSEGGGVGRGRSSTMPQKRNPVGATAVVAAVRRAHGIVPVLFGTMFQEHERAAGGWQAEWASICELFELTAFAVDGTAEMLAGLRVDPERMLANLASTRGLIMAESLAMALASKVGRKLAGALVDAACSRVIAGGGTLSGEALADAAIRAQLSEAEIVRAFSPQNYLGATQQFIDRALAAWAALSFRQDRSPL